VDGLLIVFDYSTVCVDSCVRNIVFVVLTVFFVREVPVMVAEFNYLHSVLLVL
jgi:hypothetical protein